MSTLEPGQSFSHYTIVSQLAADESGTLYRAYDSGAASDVLLRVLPAALAQAAGFEARFQALGASLRKLSNPNILRVLESGIADGAPYLSMPIVEAAPLAERIAGGQVAPAQASKLIGQIASAVQYAHDNGVVHGALNPAHVLVDGSGNALVTDFGLAALEAGKDAPDPRADVAALGGVLLSLLTGKAAAPDSAALAAALEPLTTALPADRREAVSAAYARVIAKLTAGERPGFDSARGFLDEWRAAGAQPAAPPARPEAASGPAAGMPAPADAGPSGIAPAGGPATRAQGPTFTASPPIVPPIVPPAVPGGPAARPGAGTAVSTAAQDLAEARARAQKIMAEAQAKKKAEADAARAKADAAAQQVKTDAEFAAAQARNAAARAPGAPPVARDTLRSALEISQRIAHSTPDPVRRAALEQIIADIRAIGEQRAAGQMTDEAAHAAITDLVRQVRTLEAQAGPVTRDAAQAAAGAALSRAQAAAPVVRQAVTAGTAAAARPVARVARPVIAIIAVIILVVCAGLVIVCGALGSLTTDSTPTPEAFATRSQTRAALTATAPPAAAVGTPRAIPTRAVPVLAPTEAPLQTKVVFTDTFAAGSCNLAEGDDTRRTLKCDRNQYVMLVKPAVARWVYYDSPEYQNIVIDFDARAISSAPSMEYGVIWRVSSDGNTFYGLTLKPNGQMAVFLYKDSDFSYFISGVTVSNFRTGGNLNHVTVTANGPHLAFAVNGETLPITLSDDTLDSGTLGFIVNTSAPNASASFSNLVVSEIQ